MLDSVTGERRALYKEAASIGTRPSSALHRTTHWRDRPVAPKHSAGFARRAERHTR
jgi:hypothetical protein